MSACRFCGGDLAPGASKCRHCGEWLDDRDAAKRAAFTDQAVRDQRTVEGAKGCAWIIGVLGLIVVAGLLWNVATGAGSKYTGDAADQYDTYYTTCDAIGIEKLAAEESVDPVTPRAVAKAVTAGFSDQDVQVAAEDGCLDAFLGLPMSHKKD